MGWTPRAALLAAAMLLVYCGASSADEQMVPLAVSGDWIAMAHREYDCSR